MPLPAGTLIDGKYRLVRVIGTGGMGAVYEGENLLIRRRVAIKILHAGSTGNVDAIRRFEREAQAAGSIGNDHILEVLDLGSLENNDRYLVMEYLDGETLAVRIERHGRLEPNQIAPIARQFLTALASAHAAGIIHRDLKPENIFILRSKAGRADFVKLIDFGISKFSRPFGQDEHRMTRADAVLGTPCYMSPEQARGAAEAGVRSDIYSCGVILFESVTGRLPFEGESFNDLMFKIALNDAPSPLTFVPSLDPDFAWLINRAIARDPEARFASAQEFAEALDEWMRKNALTETLALPRPSDAFPPRMRPQQNSETVAMEGPPTGNDFTKTGPTGEPSWAHAQHQSIGDTVVPPRKKGRLAAFSIGGLLAVGFAIALLVRADPAPTAVTTAAAAIAAPSPSPAESARAPAGDPAPAPSQVVAAATAASASAAVSAHPDPVHAEVHSEPARDAAPKPHPSVAPEKPKPKPAAPATSKAFDLGY